MKHEVKSVFIAGGTGFIGYYTARLFLEKGCSVSTIALPDEIDLGKWYPKDVKLYFGDLFQMEENEIVSLLKEKEYDTFVYCLGPDDRELPPAPAYNFFHSRLVVQANKICRAAKLSGFKKYILLNSYFSYFDRLQNGKLSDKHPYIRCRIEQAETITQLGEPGIFDVMVMELPYIFGAMPERFPIWKKLFVDRFKKMPFIIYPGGGTASVHVTGVAQAIFATACNGIHGGQYPVCSTNIKYREMFGYMMACSGFPKKWITMPVWIGFLSGLFIKISERIKKKQSGLNMISLLAGLLHQDFYIDPDKIKVILNYKEFSFTEEKSVWEGMREAMERSYPETYSCIPEYNYVRKK